MIKWSVPKIWDGGEVWILGGGPSIVDLFGIPHDVRQRIKNGHDVSIYSEYLKELHDRHVLGVNMAYLLGNWLSGLYFGDRSFFKKNMTKLPGFKKLKITHSHLHIDDLKYHRDIKYLTVQTKKYGLSTDPKVVYWNKNSGNAAINVATLAGAKRVLLLGFDGTENENRDTHWHNEYGPYRIKEPSFTRFSKGYEQISQDAKKLKVEILNVNPKSKIKEFKKVDLKEVL